LLFLPDFCPKHPIFFVLTPFELRFEVAEVELAAEVLIVIFESDRWLVDVLGRLDVVADSGILTFVNFSYPDLELESATYAYVGVIFLAKLLFV
jgi:hypothetical protein